MDSTWIPCGIRGQGKDLGKGIIEDHMGMVLETVSVVISGGEDSSSCLIMRM